MIIRASNVRQMFERRVLIDISYCCLVVKASCSNICGYQISGWNFCLLLLQDRKTTLL